MAGIKVIKSRAIKKNATMGIAFLESSTNDISDMELATKRFTPIGGVTKPMAKLVTMITPKCIGGDDRKKDGCHY